MNHPLFQSLIEATGWTLLHFIWQAAIAVVILWILLKVFINKTAQTRYLISCLSLLLLTITSFSTLIIYFNSADHSQQPISLSMNAEIDEADLSNNDNGDSELLFNTKFPDGNPDITDQVLEIPTQSSQLILQQNSSVYDLISGYLKPWFSWIVSFWLFGVSLLSIRLLNSWRIIRNMVHSGKSPEDSVWNSRLDALKKQLKISKPVQLLVSSSVAVPIVIGWLKPVILVPGSLLTGMNTDQLEAILAHELAHIRRHDYLVNILQNMMEILFFYHPGLKWISSQIRIERECCCDDIASEVSGDKLLYARALTALVGLHSEPAPFALAASGGSLLMRIQRLLKVDEPNMKSASGSGVLMTTLLSIFVVLPLFFVFMSDNLDAEISPTDKEIATAAIQEEEKDDEETQPVEKQKEEKGHGWISGKIVMEDGTPATVEGILYYQDSDRIDSRGTHTDQFTIKSKHGEFRLKYIAKGYAPVITDPIQIGPNYRVKKNIKLVLKKGFSKRIQIRNHNNEPVPEASFYMTDGMKKPFGSRHTFYMTKVDKKGEFLLEGLADNPYDFTVNASGYEILRAIGVHIKPDEPFILKMTRSEPTTGTVFNADGTPAKNAQIVVGIEYLSGRIYGSDIHSIVTDEKGKYSIDQLSRKSHYFPIMIAKNKARMVIPDLVVGSKERKITIPRRKDLKIRITGNIGLLPTSQIKEKNRYVNKPYIQINQTFPFKPEKDVQLNVLSDHVYITPKEDGGTALYQGLVSGKVELTIGDTSKDVG